MHNAQIITYARNVNIGDAGVHTFWWVWLGMGALNEILLIKLWAGSGHINNINITYITLIRFFMCDLEKNMQLFVSELTD